MEPPRSLTASSSLPPEGAARLRSGESEKTDTPPLEDSLCVATPPLQGAAPAARRSRSRGPCLHGMLHLALRGGYSA